MSAFVWTLSIINAAVTLMALFNVADSNDPDKRAKSAGALMFHGALALWGFWLLLA